ncbi:hypothetical protein JOL62DRAFT_587393, partial [Phyllosticta paracitricarpa]|uniref:Uncharacterized protein n=2 Tax=Phyllosticta TaxID=121621 RepID=A0ABR1LIN6_9PEZI
MLFHTHSRHVDLFDVPVSCCLLQMSYFPSGSCLLVAFIVKVPSFLRCFVPLLIVQVVMMTYGVVDLVGLPRGGPY